MFFALYSNNKDYDEVYIQNYAKINLVPKLQRVKGVGQVNVIGAKDYSMRIWIDPEKMSSYNIAPKDVQDALREQNVEAALVKLVKMPKVFMNMSSNIRKTF
jgi:HAE1 family hydrophobic/amphiphilic exporter-1